MDLKLPAGGGGTSLAANVDPVLTPKKTIWTAPGARRRCGVKVSSTRPRMSGTGLLPVPYDLRPPGRKDFAEAAGRSRQAPVHRATITSPYAPGSHLKPATAVAALESGGHHPHLRLYFLTPATGGGWKYHQCTLGKQTRIAWKRQRGPTAKIERAPAPSPIPATTYFMEMGLPHGDWTTLRRILIPLLGLW